VAANLASVTEPDLSWSVPTEFDGTTRRAAACPAGVAPRIATPSATEERISGSFWCTFKSGAFLSIGT
jgi:hypothetical protein